MDCQTAGRARASPLAELLQELDYLFMAKFLAPRNPVHQLLPAGRHWLFLHRNVYGGSAEGVLALAETQTQTPPAAQPPSQVQKTSHPYRPASILSWWFNLFLPDPFWRLAIQANACFP